MTRVINLDDIQSHRIRRVFRQGFRGKTRGSLPKSVSENINRGLNNVFFYLNANARNHSKLPYDINIGRIHLCAGVDLSVLIACAQRWHDEAEHISNNKINALTDDPSTRQWMQIPVNEESEEEKQMAVNHGERVPKAHVLKINLEAFKAVLEWRKFFEIRLNDRDYRVGDLLFLKEWDGEQFTGNWLWRQVSYISTYEQKPGYCVLSIQTVGAGKS